MQITSPRTLLPNGHRDATMVLVAYRHGLRVAELVDRRRDQVDFRAGTLKSVESGGARPARTRSSATNCANRPWQATVWPDPSTQTVRESRAIRRGEGHARKPPRSLWWSRDRAPGETHGQLCTKMELSAKEKFAVRDTLSGSSMPYILWLHTPKHALNSSHFERRIAPDLQSVLTDCGERSVRRFASLRALKNIGRKRCIDAHSLLQLRLLRLSPL
jgi:hypothetical protein